MLKTLIISPDANDQHWIADELECLCPQVQLVATTQSTANGIKIVEQKTPDLVICNLNQSSTLNDQFLRKIAWFDLELILISKDISFALQAIHLSASGYILEPISRRELINAVYRVERKLHMKREIQSNKELLKRLVSKFDETKQIGIPTIKGYDFLYIKDIIRCEGLDKYTRVITLDKSNIVSSKNLGEFRKLLESYNFFSPHKSHLINLNYLKQYLKEGIIIMQDQSQVPISRRKKQCFLSLIKHL